MNRIDGLTPGLTPNFTGLYSLVCLVLKRIRPNDLYLLYGLVNSF